ncbi:hypothetical protein Tco_0868912 [Tanacetum coccineum]
MNERCSTILLNKLPSKEKDPGSFTIPYNIGHLHINNALADLGASISLFPYTMYEKLGLEEPKPTRMSLELADRIPINLGRPFLATARAMINVFNKKITLRVGDDEGLEKSINQSDLESCDYIEDKSGNDSDLGTPIWPSANEIDEKKPELKDLLHHLEYAYLHGDKSFPIIISSKLSEKVKMLLLQVLEKHKGAFAWKMSDIMGISLSLCIHKILMVDDFKPVIQHQSHLNPKVQDVVKNEIVKLLDSGLIYLILDNSWVSLIHVVPNKGGTTVVLNENNELIPSRTFIGWRVILPNSNSTRRSREDDVHLSLSNFCLQENVVWVIQRTCNFSKMYDDDFPRHGGRLYGSVHGRFIGIEVDRAKIDVIAKLPYPTNVKGVRSFLAKPNDDEPRYADYVNYIVGKIVPPRWTPEKRRSHSGPTGDITVP